jgi:hypothetical protein
MVRRFGLVVLAGGVLGLGAEWVGFGWADPRHWIPDLAVGWTFIGCGLVAWARRPASRTGPLMAATGFTWFVGNFASVGVAAVAWVAGHMVYLHRGPLVQLVLTYPSGRPSSRLVRGAVVVGYAVAVITPIWQSAGATILLAGLLVAICARDYVAAVGPFRRARLIALQAAAGLSLVLAGTTAARLLLPLEQVSGPTLLVYKLALCVLATGLLAGLLVAPWQRAVVTDLVVELGEARSGTLRGELARALGDPTLGCWPTRGCWRRSPPRPSWQPPTPDSRPRCGPGSRNWRHRAGGSLLYGMRSVGGWSVACTIRPRLGSGNWR